MLEVESLNVWLPLRAGDNHAHIVRDVSFSVRTGERVGLVGESGCGKSTLLLSLMGLLPGGAIISGAIRLDGRDLLAAGGRELEAARGNLIALIPQSAMNALNPVRRIGAQIREGLPLTLRADRDKGRDRIATLLDDVGLPSSVIRAYPHELSGGMRQRAVIAMALATGARLLLADEATTALDTVVQARIIELLDQVCVVSNVGLILVTHHLALASEFCDTLAVMYAGRLVEIGASDGILAAPRHPYTELLFAATPDLGTSKEHMRSIPGAPPRLDRPDAGCPFFPRCPRSVPGLCESTIPTASDAHGGGHVTCHRASEYAS
jgi:peptide/nickel transport system ATP-binding protein